VRRERRRWHLRWRGREADAEFVDHALAALLDEPLSAVLPIVTRLLRAEPGSVVD
jgi:hypothetical protein